ncbi:MAG TPA: helix-turn-helix domain-containing protein [Burkholderiales bacterium]|jgi:Helix-turn-helix domain|nr:helix-turn-helix domain-containing protein [Burkholderiales bacterium]
MAASRFLFAWRNALASSEGPAHPHDRLVALVCSLYMSSSGERCWPSQDTLAVRCRITDRSVGKALQRLVDGKWLERQPRKSPRGIPHRRYGYEYRARLPTTISNAYWKSERCSLFSGKNPGPEPSKPAPPVNGERHDTSMANAVRTNSVGELTKGDASKKSLEVSREEIAEYEAAFASGGRVDVREA